MNANSSLTISDWLDSAYRQLKEAGIPSYQLDALLIAEFALKTDRAHLLAHIDKPLPTQHHTALNELLKQRKDRKPIAYITNQIEFYGRDFYIDEHALIPRPESESFITLLKKHNPSNQHIVDLGCGSGILGITAKLELPDSPVTLIDSDQKALKIAKKNATNLNANVTLKNRNLLDDTNYDVVLANLPYVPRNLSLEPELSFEPPQALFADQNGMELYIQMWKQLARSKAHLVLTESLAIQHKAMQEQAAQAGFRLQESDDLVQLFTKG